MPLYIQGIAPVSGNPLVCKEPLVVGLAQPASSYQGGLMRVWTSGSDTVHTEPCLTFSEECVRVLVKLCSCPLCPLPGCLDLGSFPSLVSRSITVSSSSWSAWWSCSSSWKAPSNVSCCCEDSVTRSCNWLSTWSRKSWKLDSSPDSWLKAIPVETRWAAT